MRSVAVKCGSAVRCTCKASLSYRREHREGFFKKKITGQGLEVMKGRCNEEELVWMCMNNPVFL